MNTNSNNNFTLKAIAVLFAIFLWFYVGAQQDPISSRTIEVPITYQNLDEQLSLTNKISSVSLSIKGRKSNLEGLKAEDFVAIVNMAGIDMGENELPVRVTVPKTVDFVTVNPSKIKTTVDKLADKNVLVQAAVIGSTAEGYSSFSPSIKPTTIRVNGPESVLKTIHSARVEVDLANTSTNLNLSLPVMLMDDQGEVIQSNALEVLPKSVEVFLPVDKDTPSKVVAIKPMLVGNPAEGYSISRVVAEPETIKIIGTYNNLNKVDQIQTVPIYISNITEDVIQEVELKVPDGVTVMHSNKVKVLISIKESNLSQTIEQPVILYNGNEQWQVELAQPTVQMTIEGKNSDLTDPEKLKLIVPYVDLLGLGVGSHNIPVGIDNRSGLHLVQITPASIQVVISEKIDTEIPVDDKNESET